jgi:hypothetical protein
MTTTIALPGTYFPRWLTRYARNAGTRPMGVGPAWRIRSKNRPYAESPARYSTPEPTSQAGSNRSETRRAPRSFQVRIT